MAHYAVIAPPLHGHYRPFSNLASELIARGHRVTFIHPVDAAEMVSAEGAEFVRLLGTETPPEWVSDGFRSSLRGMAAFVQAFCRHGPNLVRSLRPDVLLVDQMEPGGALLAEHMRLPFATIGITVPINREPGVPPPYVGWSYRAGRAGERRNQGGWRVADLILRNVGDAIADGCARLRLPTRRTLDSCLSPALQISQLIEEVDFPREALPPHFHYTGPLRRRAEEAFALPDCDGRPLVYCTLGTLQGSRTALLERIARACEDRDLRLVITRGRAAGHIHVPARTLVYDWLPQEAVMAQAQLTICHGGMNSVLESLANGIPMVVVPLAFEQPATAARLTHAGVAERIGARASERRIARALSKVRHDRGYAERAADVRSAIGRAGGAARAADLIEQRLG